MKFNHSVKYVKKRTIFEHLLGEHPFGIQLLYHNINVLYKYHKKHLSDQSINNSLQTRFIVIS